MAGGPYRRSVHKARNLAGQRWRSRLMSAASSRLLICISLTVAVGWLAPCAASAHRFGGPNDPCERKIGTSFIHITLYQPEFDPDGEYCNEVPRAGNTVLVVDV